MSGCWQPNLLYKEQLVRSRLVPPLAGIPPAAAAAAVAAAVVAAAVVAAAVVAAAAEECAGKVLAARTFRPGPDFLFLSFSLSLSLSLSYSFFILFILVCLFPLLVFSAPWRNFEDDSARFPRVFGWFYQTQSATREEFLSLFSRVIKSAINIKSAELGSGSQKGISQNHHHHHHYLLLLFLLLLLRLRLALQQQ